MPLLNDEPVAARVQLSGQVAVLREHRAEQREAVERGVRRKHEDQRGRRLEEEEDDRVRAAEDRAGHLRDDRGCGCVAALAVEADEVAHVVVGST